MYIFKGSTVTQYKMIRININYEKKCISEKRRVGLYSSRHLKHR